MSLEEGYTVPFSVLTRLGHGDAQAGRRVLRAMIDMECDHEPIVGPTERPPNVRGAVEADEAAILDLVRVQMAEITRDVAPPDEAKIMSIVRTATTVNATAVPGLPGGIATVGVIDGVHGLAGMICLVPYAWWWSDRFFVAEFWNYVRPEARGSRYGADLVRFSRWHVDVMTEKIGSQVFLISGITGTNNPREKTALYGRLLNFCGGMFVYPWPGGGAI